jgi:hypothetical protein
LAFNSVCTLYDSRRVVIESLTGSSTPHGAYEGLGASGGV